MGCHQHCWSIWFYSSYVSSVPSMEFHSLQWNLLSKSEWEVDKWLFHFSVKWKHITTLCLLYLTKYLSKYFKSISNSVLLNGQLQYVMLSCCFPLSFLKHLERFKNTVVFSVSKAITLVSSVPLQSIRPRSGEIIHEWWLMGKPIQTKPNILCCPLKMTKTAPYGKLVQKWCGQWLRYLSGSGICECGHVSVCVVLTHSELSSQLANVITCIDRHVPVWLHDKWTVLCCGDRERKEIEQEREWEWEREEECGRKQKETTKGRFRDSERFSEYGSNVLKKFTIEDPMHEKRWGETGCKRGDKRWDREKNETRQTILIQTTQIYRP